MKVQIWFVDCQNDFINADGALPVPDAPSILENLEKLKTAAVNHGISSVYTQDYHDVNDPELSDNPDFKTTFPKHCIRGTIGSYFVDGVYNNNGIMIFDPDDDLADILMKNQNIDFIDKGIILTKQIFSTFDGNKNAETYIEATRPDVVFVCGVAGDVCVKAVVEGLLEMNRLFKDFKDAPMRICVVADAVKSLNEEATKTLYSQFDVSQVDTDFVVKFMELVDGMGDTL